MKLWGNPQLIGSFLFTPKSNAHRIKKQCFGWAALSRLNDCPSKPVWVRRQPETSAAQAAIDWVWFKNSNNKTKTINRMIVLIITFLVLGDRTFSPKVIWSTPKMISQSYFTKNKFPLFRQVLSLGAPIRIELITSPVALYHAIAPDFTLFFTVVSAGS